jgi:hypothetical protein
VKKKLVSILDNQLIKVKLKGRSLRRPKLSTRKFSAWKKKKKGKVHPLYRH